MSKLKKVIDKGQLSSVIEHLENTQTFTNQSKLFEAVASSDWGKSIGITASVVYLRINEFKIPIKTQKGKKGSGATLAQWRAEGNPVVRRRKRRPSITHPQTYEVLRKKVPTKYLPLLEKAANGSMKATTKLYCLGCCGYERFEVKNCTAVGCLYYPHRPFQDAVSEEDMDKEIQDAVVSAEEEGDSES